MKKHIYHFISILILLVGLSTTVSATHIMGGEIVWECLDNGQYQFTLKVYRDCNGTTFNVNNHALEVHNYPNVGVISQIPLSFFSVTDITPACEGKPCATLVPSDPDIAGAIEEYILISDSITLNGVPGANGWAFTWTYGDRNAAIDNIANAQNFGITLRAQMFAYNGRNVSTCFDSSPNFFQKPSSIICAGEKFTYNHSAFDRELDSLAYSWANPLDGVFCGTPPCIIGSLFQENSNPVNINFDAANGYSFDNPYPDTSLDSRNEPAVLNPQTGEITYTSYTSGEFVSVIKVEAFKCGEKVAEIYRELQTVITSGCASNKAPEIPSPFANGTYFDTVRAGELVNFDINVYDTLRTGNPRNDSISFYASGIQFGTNKTSSTTGCLNPPCATLSYPTPDTGLGTYTTTFNWQTTCDHVANSTPDCITSQNSYLFIIRAIDNFCPTGGQALATFAITILEDTLVKSPPIHCADVQSNGDVIIDWNQTPDPDSSFVQWKIYSATNINGPFNLIDSVSDYNTTTYTDVGANADIQSIHYIVRAQSGCHQNWFYIIHDTISTIYIDPSFNDTCVQVSWNPLSIPSPDGSATNYDVYREYPIGTGFSLHTSTSNLSFCDTFSVCTDSVTYRIELSNSGNGCTGSNSNTKGIRFQYPILTSSTTIADSVSCQGSSDGKAVITPVGGSLPYTYLWSNSQTTDTALNLAAGSYTVTVTDLRNCADTNLVSFSQPSELVLSAIDSIDITCNGLSDGQAFVSISGGSLPYTYLWSDNQITDTAKNLGLGKHYVTISDRNGCSLVDSTSVNEPTILNSTIDSTIDVTCNGSTNGKAISKASGGTTPYTYLWNNAQTTDTAFNLATGSFTVTITDSNNCSTSSTVSINEPVALGKDSIYKQNVSCNGLSDGMAIVVANGGTSPYTYAWSNNQNTDTIRNLSVDTYVVTVSDSNNCTYIDSIQINQPTLLGTILSDFKNPSCYGYTDGEAVVFASGGTQPYTYIWTDSQTSDTAKNLGGSDYLVTVTDANGCTSTNGAMLRSPDQLTLELDSIDVSCYGLNDGQVNSHFARGGTSPYTYSWNNSSVDDTLFNVGAGKYIVSMTDSRNCPALVDSISVMEPSQLVASISNSSEASCNGLNDGGAVVTASGGVFPYTYLWSDNQNTDTARNLAAGDYKVTLSDANGCTTIDSTTITEPLQLSVASTSTKNVSCFGANDGQSSVSISGGTAPYSYLWSNNQTSDTASNLGSGTYTVTITDNNNCRLISSTTITQPTALSTSVAVTVNVSCLGNNDGRAFVTALGGTNPYTYLWSNNQITDTAINLTAGKYFVTVTDTNNCVSIDSITISQPNRLTSIFSAYNNISCFNQNDGSISTSALGGTTPYTYFWNNNATTATINNLAAGTYISIVTDANGCTFSDTLSLFQPDSLESNLVSTTITCFGFDDGTIQASSIGGVSPYQYSWSTLQSGNSINQLSPGYYYVTTTDANNCKRVDSSQITEPITLSLMVSSDDTICVNNPKQLIANASGGTQTYTYTWSNNLGNDSSIQVNPSANTSYTVTLTDANNCPPQSETINISVRNIYDDNLNLTSSGNICRGDSSTLSYSFQGDFNPYTFTYNQGLTSLNPQKVSPNSSTTYVLTVSDICNNSISDSVLVEVSDPPVISLNDTLIEGCEDLTINFTNKTPMNFVYLWNFGDGNTSTVSEPTHTYTNPGLYKVSLEVSTPQGCESEFKGNYLIRVNPKPVPTITANPTVTDIKNSKISFSSFYTDAIDWFWDFANGESSQEESPEITFNDTGSYNVSLWKLNQFGCRDTGYQVIRINPNYEIKIPNAFTPNINGSNGGRYDPNSYNNEVFHPYIEYTKKYSLTIYNRWGELVFESKDVNIGWDGYYKGQLSQTDVYVYKLDVTFINGEKATKVGDLTLLR